MGQITENAATAVNEEKVAFAANARKFPLPPEDFDPLTASDATLRSYGLHPRPDPKVYPLLTRRWEAIYSKKPKFIQPEFQFGLQIDPIPTLNPELFWSGSAVERGTADPIRFLHGRFTVATVTRRPVALDQYVDTWVGIGGLFGNYICRAGVRQEVKTTIAYGPASPTGMLFLQWGDQPMQFMSTFPTNPGDQIEILVCLGDTAATQGYFYIYNVSHGQHMTYPFQLPAGETIDNLCAEWIVSRPAYGVGEDPSLPQPALYGAITFDEAVAYTVNGNAFGAGEGRLFSFLNFGKKASTPSLTNDLSSLVLTSSL